MIVNSSPLIIFGKLNRLNLLREVLEEIVIADEVYKEVVENGIKIDAPEAFIIKDYVEGGEIKVKKLNKEWQKKADFLKKVYKQLDHGEAETIALALQEKEKIVFIDEKIARKIAKLHGLKVKGSLGILLLAFKNKLITEKELKEIVSGMTSNKFRLSGEVINKFWILFDKIKK